MKPENLIAAMVVRGEEFERMVDLARPRAEACLQIPVVVLRPAPQEDLWDFKMSLLERLKRPVLCLDTDLLFRGWDWAPFNFERFCAVHDAPLLKWRTGAQYLSKFYDVQKGINGGLWYSPYNERFLQVFRLARHLIQTEMPKCRYAFGDQTALNQALQMSGAPYTLLPEELNWQVLKGEIPESAKVLHLVGDTLNTPEGSPQPLRKLRRFLEYHKRFPCSVAPFENSSTSR